MFTDSQYREGMQKAMDDYRAQRKAAEDADLGIKLARGSLETAQARLEDEENRLATMPVNVGVGRYQSRSRSREQQVDIVWEKRAKVEEAQKHLEETVANFWKRKAAEEEKAKEDAKKKEETERQQKFAAEEKSKYRAEAKVKWLASGGSEHSFNENYESLWIEEVKRRTTGQKSLQEQFEERLRQSGQYY